MPKLTSLALACIVVLVSAPMSQAAPTGSGDTSYGSAGRAQLPVVHPPWRELTAVPLPNGGAYVFDQAASLVRIAKLDSTGKPDRSWGIDGTTAPIRALSSQPVVGSLDPAGNLVLAGTRAMPGSVDTEGFLVRLDHAGRHGAAREISLTGPWTTTAVAVSMDDRVYVAGTRATGRAVVRAISAGTTATDTSWGMAGDVEVTAQDTRVTKIAIDHEGRLLVVYDEDAVGHFGYRAGSGVARIDAAGRIDSSYGYAPAAAPRLARFDSGPRITAIDVQPGGRTLLAVAASSMMVSGSFWPAMTGFATLTDDGRLRLTSPLRFDASVHGFTRRASRTFATGHVEFAGLGPAPVAIALTDDGLVDTSWGYRGIARPLPGSGVPGRHTSGMALASGRVVSRVLTSGSLGPAAPRVSIPASCQRAPVRPWALACAWHPGERISISISRGVAPQIQKAYTRRLEPAMPWRPKRPGDCRMVRAVDARGATSPWVEACTARTRQETQFRRSVNWRVEPRSAALGGRVLVSDTAGATASIDTGKLVPDGYRLDLSMSLVFTKCPTCGKVLVTSDTGMRKLISLQSRRTLPRSQVFLETLSADDAGPLGTRLTIRTIGRGRVELDGIAWVPSETFGLCSDPFAYINGAGFCYELGGA